MNKKEDNKGSLYLITGIVIGLLIGYVFSRWVLPVKYINTEPYTLNDPDKQTYREVISRAYMAEADFDRAVTRLNLLGDANPAEVLVAQAQSLIGSGKDNQARALALLASVLSNPSTSITPLSPVRPTPTATSENSASLSTTPEQTRTPSSTMTPRPTMPPQATQGAPFELVEQNTVCDAGSARPLLQITVLDAADHSVSGEPIEISTNDGTVETFYTGFYPEISSGYADYVMQPGVIYAIRVGKEGKLVSNLYIPSCSQTDGSMTAGNLSLVFQQY